MKKLFLSVLSAVLAGSASAESTSDVPLKPPDLQVTLGQDYDCVTALPMWQGADGNWIATPDRKTRIDCMINGAQGELNVYRPSKDGKPKESPSLFSNVGPWHFVIPIVSAIALGYVQISVGRLSRGCHGALNPFGHCG